MDNDTTPSRERLDLIEALTVHRQFLRGCAEGLSEEQARLQPTASELSIGGIIKHVAATESAWAQFMVDGSGVGGGDVDWSEPDPAFVEAYLAGFRLGEGDTVEGVLADYERVAAATDRLVLELDLDRAFPLPSAPWFPPDADRSVRRSIVHIIAETAQHAGHADIIRETIDGRKSMG